LAINVYRPNTYTQKSTHSTKKQLRLGYRQDLQFQAFSFTDLQSIREQGVK